ncbi:hypothetical protein EDC01DRAFT_641805 [Geopyxis carbonaria]|nr:hypothetical protein EDC01DRAFT_641805 [Geopyxis carbonaria]
MFTFVSPRPAAQSGSSVSHQLKRKRPSTPTADSSPSAIAQREIAHPGRTLKRWRNNRPSEDSVHQYTLAKLFSAAKAVIPITPKQQVLAPQPQQLRPEKMDIQPTQQRSLFSVLVYGQRSAPTVTPTQEIKIQCDDCDRAFSVPAQDEDTVRCVGCGRTVCDLGCSASNGEGRVCLECARS